MSPHGRRSRWVRIPPWHYTLGRTPSRHAERRAALAYERSAE